MNVALIGFFQTYENYGDTDAPYWKPKGGVERFFATFTLDQWLSYSTDEKHDLAHMFADCAMDRENNEYSHMHLIDWQTVTLCDDMLRTVKEHIATQQEVDVDEVNVSYIDSLAPGQHDYLRWSFGNIEAEYAFDWAIQQMRVNEHHARA